MSIFQNLWRDTELSIGSTKSRKYLFFSSRYFFSFFETPISSSISDKEYSEMSPEIEISVSNKTDNSREY